MVKDLFNGSVGDLLHGELRGVSLVKVSLEGAVFSTVAQCEGLTT